MVMRPIPDGYERCNGELSVEVGIERGPYREDESINVELKCKRCGQPHLDAYQYEDDEVTGHRPFSLSDALDELVAKGLDTMAGDFTPEDKTNA